MSGNRVYAAEAYENEIEEETNRRCTHAKVIKMILSGALVLIAVMFGGLVPQMNLGCAFLTVFAYISAQIGLWI